MKVQHKYTEHLIKTMDLPQDLFLGLPNIYLSGNLELYISNHRGILLFSQEEINVLADKSQIQVKGRGLTISSYTKDEIIIKGYILSIGFI